MQQSQEKVYDLSKYNFKNNVQFSHKLNIAKLPVSNLKNFFHKQKIHQVTIFPPTSFLKNNIFYEKLKIQLEKWNQCVRKNQLPDKAIVKQKLYGFISSRMNSINYISPSLQQLVIQKLYLWFNQRKQTKTQSNNSKLKIEQREFNQKENMLKIESEIQQVRSTFKSTAPSRLFQYDRHHLALPTRTQNNFKTDVQFYSKKLTSCSSRQLFTNRILVSENKPRKSKPNRKFDIITDGQSDLIKSPKSDYEEDYAIMELNRKWFQNENRIAMESKEMQEREKFINNWANSKERSEEILLNQKQLLKQSNYRKNNYKMRKQSQSKINFKEYLNRLEVFKKDQIKKNKISQTATYIEHKWIQPKSAIQLIKSKIKKQKIKNLFLKGKHIKDIVDRNAQKNSISQIQQPDFKSQLAITNHENMFQKCEQETIQVNDLKKQIAKNKMICSLQTLTKAIVSPLVTEKKMEILRPGSTLIVNPYQKQRKKSRRKKKKK